MALSNIHTVERNGKSITLHGKDMHSATMLFGDEKSTPSLPLRSQRGGCVQN